MFLPRRSILIASALLTFVFAAGVSIGCKRNSASLQAESLPAVPVRVIVAQNELRPSVEEVVGTVRPKLRAAIEAKVSARIETLLVSPGKTVKAGELIAQLDAREIQAKLDQALAVREQTTRDLARARDLMEKKITTQAEFDSAQARERVSVGATTEAETMLAYTKIVAPFDGVVTRKLADVGDLAAPGRPIVEVEDPSALRFEADVPEALIGSVKLGLICPVRLGNATRSIEGKVVEMAPVADPASRTFLVKLDLPPGGTARSGQFGRAAIATGQRETLRVPAAAVISRGQVEAVFVVPNQHAQLRLVRTGKHDAREIELLSGVTAGEKIVTDGADQLRDGQPITLKP